MYDLQVVLSTLHYGNKAWTTYAKQEKCLKQLPSLMPQMHSWHHLEGTYTKQGCPFVCADIPSMFALLSQRRPSWLGHFCHMVQGVSTIPAHEYQICSDQHRVLGICCSRPLKLATDCAERYEEGRRNELWMEKRQRRRERPSTTMTNASTSNCLHLYHLQQTLPQKNRTF